MLRYGILGMFLLFSACAPDITETDFYREHPEEVDLQDTVVELGAQTDGGLNFRLRAPDPVHIGHSTVWIEGPASAGEYILTPLWEMSTRTLVSPLAAAAARATEVEGRFEATPFFLQPAAEDGAWLLQVEYEVDGRQGMLIFPVEVESDLWVQRTSDYYVSWVQPVRPSTGQAPFEVALHRLTAEGFVPMEDAILDLYPYMDMGAGEGHSTPYHAPVYVRDGAYSGSVNFIMSGGWDMTVYIQRPGVAVDTVLFEGFTVH